MLVLALTSCTSANRKGGMVIGGGMLVGGAGLGTLHATTGQPNNRDSWVNFDDAILPVSIGVAALGAAILVGSILTDEKPAPPPLPPPAP